MSQRRIESIDLIAILVPVFSILLIITILVIMSAAGLFNFTPTDPESKVIAATLALIGVLVTASITLTGSLIKFSIDKRNYDLTKQAEERLRMETAIRAVSLLSTTKGDDSPKSQKAGALFTLSCLGQMEFALALASQLWRSNEIDLHTIGWVVNEALLTDNKDIHETAVEILYHSQPERLFHNDHFYWPKCLEDSWSLEICEDARKLLFHLLINIITSKPARSWNRNQLLIALWFFYQMMHNDSIWSLKNGAAKAIKILCKLMNLNDIPEVYLGFPEGRTQISQLVDEVEEILIESKDELKSSMVVESIKRMEAWYC